MFNPSPSTEVDGGVYRAGFLPSGDRRVCPGIRPSLPLSASLEQVHTIKIRDIKTYQHTLPGKHTTTLMQHARDVKYSLEGDTPCHGCPSRGKDDLNFHLIGVYSKGRGSHCINVTMGTATAFLSRDIDRRLQCCHCFFLAC